MADKKITDLPEIPEVADDDYLEIVDTSANTSNKISRENLIAGHDHDSDYLGISAKAADSAKLGGVLHADYPQHVIDTALGENTGVWQAFTPTWSAPTTNPSLGNGVLDGRYVVFGTMCTLVVGLVMGSTTTYGSGNWAFSLPKTAKKTSGINFYGVAHIRKVGTANYERIAQISPSISTTVINMFTDPTPGSNSANISATVPFTWGDGDSLGFQITYEIE
jgi:hypothetical protein